MRLFPRKNSSGQEFLWVDFMYQGKRYRKPLNIENTAKNRKLAHNSILPELQIKLYQGAFIENTKTKIPTIGEFVETSFAMHKAQRRELTQKKYEQCYRQHIKPYFEKKQLDKIKPSDLAKWQNMLLEDRSGKTVRGIRTVFQTIFEDAMIDEIINVNPFSRVKAPKNDEVRAKKPFSQEEIFAIIEAVPETMQCFFAMGFFTGMRTGEIIGLRWDDVDWDEGIIHVQRSRRQGIETAPKTKNSIREVEIIDVLMAYLIKHRERSGERSVYIFETYLNEPFTTCDKISYWYWKPALTKAGVPYRNLYQMRHSFASLMISSGEDILWVSNMLGHKDASMTLEKYARYIKQTRRKRAAFLLE